ncbi:MAG: pseudouridine synthase [Bacteroidales bacterium]|nr:pseudouridine synthase [Bacteroidales bacterium]
MEKMPAGRPGKRAVKKNAGTAAGERRRDFRPAEGRTEGDRRRPARPFSGNTEGERKRPARPAEGRTEGDRRRPDRPFDGKAEGVRKRPARPAEGRTEGDRRRPARPFDGKAEGVRRPARPVAPGYAGTRKRNIKAVASKATDEPVRLNKFIANSGVCARREADELIKQGYISVNGKKVTDMGIKVKPTDKVEYKGKQLSPGKKVYILINKPKGYVTTVKDPHAESTVLDLVKDATKERIYPVGRLDKATTGVLLLTNDGDLAGKLTHPSYGAAKVYHVFLDKEVTRNDMEALVTGVTLEEGMVSADAVSYPEPEDRTQVGVEIHSGQNRVVRRIFEKLGYRVRKLDRVSFAGLTKKNLQRGHWRELTIKEVNMLKRGIFK